MPIESVASFDVKRWTILDEQGNVDEKMKPALSNEQLVLMYRSMVRSRLADDKMLKMQRQGRMGTFASVLGQEAQVAVGFAMDAGDWLVPSFRENAVMMTRGVPMENIFLTFGGDERGSLMPEGVNVLPISIPVGSQAVHATGLGMAFTIQKEPKVAVGFLGDGGTSEGDFHEALNFAGVFNAKTVIVCQNNQWAISTARKHQTASQTIAQKAIAYGIEGIQVDGNDVLAVYAASKYALDKARSGKGPTLLELVTYRMGDHTTADDATKYRDKAEVELWRKKDPILRLQKYLEKGGVWNINLETKIVTEESLKVEEAVKQYEAYPKQNPDSMFQFVYEQADPELLRQREELRENVKERENNGH